MNFNSIKLTKNGVSSLCMNTGDSCMFCENKKIIQHTVKGDDFELYIETIITTNMKRICEICVVLSLFISGT